MVCFELPANEEKRESGCISCVFAPLALGPFFRCLNHQILERCPLPSAANALAPWLAAAGESELKSFAAGIRRDYDAVLAALLFQWSNGQVEGQVNRVKLVKRSMYGRAGFALLRKRVLRAA